jgi:hypothetical protein
MENQCGSQVLEFKEIKHDLLSNKYTKVDEEINYQYNAPHYFVVRDAKTVLLRR